MELWKSRNNVLARHIKIKRMRMADYSLSEIGREVGLTKQAVRNHVVDNCKCAERFEVHPRMRYRD